MAAVKRSLNVGMVGVGRIGGPLLVNLAFKARNALYLQVHSRSKAKASGIVDKLHRDGAQVGIRLHDQYGTVTRWCDVVITTLADEGAQRSVMLERSDALLRNARRGQIFIDHTTVDAATARECYEVAQRRGAAYMDAPLTGTLGEARSGMMTAMVGGDRAAFDKAVSLMRMYTENVHYVGGPGTGAAAKSVSQALIAMHTAAAAEAVTLANSLGISDINKVMHVLDGTHAASGMLRRNAPLMTRLVRNPDRIPRESLLNIDGLLHDLSLARAASRDLPDAALPLLSTTRRAFAQASQAGVGDRDVSAVAHFLEGAAGDLHDGAPSDGLDGPEGSEPAFGSDGLAAPGSDDPRDGMEFY